MSERWKLVWVVSPKWAGATSTRSVARPSHEFARVESHLRHQTSQNAATSLPNSPTRPPCRTKNRCNHHLSRPTQRSSPPLVALSPHSFLPRPSVMMHVWKPSCPAAPHWPCSVTPAGWNGCLPFPTRDERLCRRGRSDCAKLAPPRYRQQSRRRRHSSGSEIIMGGEPGLPSGRQAVQRAPPSCSTPKPIALRKWKQPGPPSSWALLHSWQ